MNVKTIISPNKDVFNTYILEYSRKQEKDLNFSNSNNTQDAVIHTKSDCGINQGKYFISL